VAHALFCVPTGTSDLFGTIDDFACSSHQFDVASLLTRLNKSRRLKPALDFAEGLRLKSPQPRPRRFEEPAVASPAAVRSATPVPLSSSREPLLYSSLAGYIHFQALGDMPIAFTARPLLRMVASSLHCFTALAARLERRPLTHRTLGRKHDHAAQKESAMCQARRSQPFIQNYETNPSPVVEITKRTRAAFKMFAFSPPGDCDPAGNYKTNPSPSLRPPGVKSNHGTRRQSEALPAPSRSQ